MRDEQISRLRQTLRAAHEFRGRALQALLSERRELIRGALGTRARVCGNPNCRCARGERHESKFLSVAIDGRTRMVHVPASDEVRVAAGVERHRHFRQLRGQLANGDELTLSLLDELCALLLAAYPQEDPIPAPKKRGRPKKQGHDRAR